MKKFELTKMQSLVQDIIRLFRVGGKTEPHPYVLVGFEKDAVASVDPYSWKLAEIALIDAERRKAQAYMTRLHDSIR